MFAPTIVDPVIVAPEWGNHPWLRVVVVGEEYKAASEAKMWSSTKPGTYGRGLANEDGDPGKAERTGRLGEMALAKLLGLQVNLEYTELGEDCDFMIGPIKVDVKTSMRCTGYALIYASSVWSKRDIRVSDRYVFGFIESDDREKMIASVVLTGYIKSSLLQGRPMVPGFKHGGHRNYLIYYHESLPIIDLVVGVKFFQSNCVPQTQSVQSVPL